MTYVVFNPCFSSKSTVVRRVSYSSLYAQIRDNSSNISMTQPIRALRDFFKLMVKERKISIKYCYSKNVVNEGLEFMVILNLEGNPFHAAILLSIPFY